ncbi:MAG TPA: HlyD family efflux transporter periplasmic adaptor subunit [Kofleriaceae bacterium]|nr:HlyD family efflux transporter periplasmic adaptor subunit [Kofleriaceae bacterium]
MATPFRHTIRALERGRARPWLVAGGALALVAAWLIWFFLAEVPIYQSSLGGRIESDAEARPIEAPVAGTIVGYHLAVDRRVGPGEILVELDATPIRLELAEVRARLTGLEAEMRTLEATRDSQQALIAELEQEGRLAVREAETSLRGLRADAELARRESERAAELHRDGLSSQSELDQATARRTQSGATVEALGVRVNRLRTSGRLQLDERRVRLSEVEREIAVVTGSMDLARGAIARLEHEIERRTIRAPLAGTIGSLGSARVGSYLSEGDDIAVLVPDGSLRAVCSFSAASAGRLHAGQPVVLRFPAFPWTAYGSRRGRVARVASEARDERLRVDIEIVDDPASRIALEHGQEVVAEVQTEVVSPALLLLRNAGVLLGGRSKDEP